MLSACVASRSHYLHSKVHRQARVSTEPAYRAARATNQAAPGQDRLPRAVAPMQKGRSVTAAAFLLSIVVVGSAGRVLDRD